MNIYTSNYRASRALSETDYLLVSISRRSPKHWAGAQCKDFAPSSSLLAQYHRGMSEVEYTDRYRQEIDELSDFYSVFVQLAKLAKGRDIVLLCYEKKGDFCHRHILSDIVFERYGYRINEL